ncbi:MAG: hypothetical protein NTZ33_06200 [Bacteroidetes bacterium]|nr:hypothetical protein [Bacteroidota bacterium]
MIDFENFLICASKYGLWDIISVLVLLSSFLIVLRFIFFPFFYVKNLSFYVKHVRDQSNYPSKLIFDIKNSRNENLVLSNVYFKPKKLIADSKAYGDTSKKIYELKFDPNYTDPDCLITHGNNALTWFPLDPNIIDSEIEKILNPDKIGFLFIKCKPKIAGNFHCKCTFLTNRPRTIRLIRKY